VQLTWQSKTGLVYNVSDFHVLRQFSYSGEGWGITSSGREIFMSDGTPEIRVLDSSTLAEKRRFTVHDGDTPIDQLNELEFVDGEIFATCGRLIESPGSLRETVWWSAGLISRAF
jgi:glutaminyl-peptide cyclotransferase